MKALLLVVSYTYLFFGTTVYVGVLWALHFFFYPTWIKLNLDNVQDHFIIPTDKATQFFTIVVPLMFLTNVILIVKEWKTRLRWVGLFALVCIGGATYVGQIHIIPVNKKIKAGVATMEELTAFFQQWMFLNDIRLIIMTIMWLTMMYYFIAKGNLLKTFREDNQ